jgi:tripeptidyl-peptidase-1
MTACTSYSLPEVIQPHVELITPSVHFDALVPRPRQETPSLKKRKLNNKPVSGAAKSLGRPDSFNGPKLSPDRASSSLKGIITELENCDEFITPFCLRALYNVVYKPVATHKNSYGIVEYTPQAFLASDLDLFFKNFSSGLIGSRPNLVSIDGGQSWYIVCIQLYEILIGVVQTTNQSFNFNGESDLDLEYGMTIAAPQKITLYQAGDLPQG